MMADLWAFLRRFRTWLFNIAAALVVVLPELIAALAGHDWRAIVPPEYMPYVTAAIIIVNVMLRPRPAAIKEKGGE